MAFRDLRAFCAHLEAKGALRRVPTPVSADLELAEVADRVARRGGPALLFEQVEGFDAPVLVGAFAAADRAAWALGAEELSGLARRFEELLGLARGGVAGGFGDKLKAFGELASLRRIAPRRVEKGACQEVSLRVPSLDVLPIPRHWPADGGRTVTLPLLVQAGPGGRRVVGTGRMQVHDARTLSWPLALPPGTARVPAAVAIGGDTAALFAAGAPLPAELDPLLFAGFLRRAPVDVVRCRSCALDVPAAAEYVLEGSVLADDRRPAGPFGERTGYYAPAAELPTFHVTTITRRREPLYLTSLPGRGGDDTYLARAAERLTLPFVQLLQPEIVDIAMPAEGLVLVAIRKEYPGQPQKVIAGLLGLMPTMLARAVLVFDHDVELTDAAACAWRAAANVDWRRDVLVMDGPLGALEHAAPRPGVGAKIGIDATRKQEDARHPRPWPADVTMAPEVRALVDRKWASYGIPL